MGLDMYLRASEYVSRKDYFVDDNGNTQSKDNDLFSAIVENFGVADHIDQDGFAGISIDFPMGYWRKANQIHNWFVKNVQDDIDNCQTVFVSREHLEKLKEVCINVIAVPEMARELLPTSSGFFFGSTDYDEYYKQDLVDTVGIITRCLESKFDYFEYQASW